jgi:hypothetical protein
MATRGAIRAGRGMSPSMERDTVNHSVALFDLFNHRRDELFPDGKPSELQ